MACRWEPNLLAIPTFPVNPNMNRSEEHTSELQSQSNLVCRLLLEKPNTIVGDGPSGHVLERRVAAEHLGYDERLPGELPPALIPAAIPHADDFALLALARRRRLPP